MAKGDASDGAAASGASPFAPPVKRSVTIAGHQTAISLEPIFWQALRDAAAEVDALNHDGWSPLAVACQVGNWRLARFLLERGARSEPADGTPVLLAAAATVVVAIPTDAASIILGG